jgi:O-antigen/teichoic acid export membrane protein
MGVIKRQSIKQSLVNYFAVGIAAVSTILIYPQDKETYGLARFIIDTSMIAAPFILLGFAGAGIRFFPQFKNEAKGHRGFLFFLLLAVAFGSLIYILLGFVFKDFIYNIFADKTEIYRQFLPYLIPIAIFIAFFNLLFSYSANFKRIVVPAILQNLIKVSLPLLILFYLWQMLTLEQLVDGILINYAVALLGIVLYIYWLGQLKLKPDFSLLTKTRVREIGSFAMFNLFGSIGSVLAFRIDSIMISTLLDFQSNGAYAIAAFIANAIAIPTNAVSQISGPIVTESFRNNDLSHVKKLYQDSSINLLIIGLLLFVCIIASVEDLFSIMPKSEELRGGLLIVLFIGAAKIVDMATSINNQIISYSKYYRFGFYAILMMAVFNIVTNIILIPKYQIIGAAAATFASLSLYNLVKMLFIQWKFKMQPFTLKTLWILIIAGVAYFIATHIPVTNIAVLNIIIRSVVIGIIYIAAVLYFDISREYRDMILSVIQKIKSMF